MIFQYPLRSVFLSLVLLKHPPTLWLFTVFGKICVAFQDAATAAAGHVVGRRQQSVERLVLAASHGDAGRVQEAE